MAARLAIRREYWSDVTEIPHFVVDLAYAGCRVVHEDIYIDDIDDVIAGLEVLQRDRSGQVVLDGGSRFVATVGMTGTGGVRLGFRTESAATFPGRLRLEGYFSRSGEYAGQVLDSLIGLFRDGRGLVISRE